MKKVSITYILLLLIVCYAPIIVSIAVLNLDLEMAIGLSFWGMVMGSVLLLNVIRVIFNRGTKGVKKKLKQLNFHIDSTIVTKNNGIWVDIEKGQMAYLTVLNPFNIQVFNAACINEVRREVVKELGFDGTRLIRIVLRVGKDTVKIVVWKNHLILDMRTLVVLKAAAKADEEVQKLLAARAIARG